MAVFYVEATYLPNGNRRARPVVADSAEQAREMVEAEWGERENDPTLTWTVTERPDPDGSHERSLLDMERRRFEMGYR